MHFVPELFVIDNFDDDFGGDDLVETGKPQGLKLVCCVLISGKAEAMPFPRKLVGPALES